MADNVVQITIQGIDDATRVFNRISGNADQAFGEIESALNSIPDLDIDVNVDAQRAESQLEGIESAVNEVDSAIKALPDPQIDGSKAEKELEDVSKQANETKKSIEDIDFSSIAGGLVAGGGIAGIVEKSLDVSSLDTQIKVSFNVPPESIESVKQATKTVQSYGVDAESALEGVRRQFALNADASDETNQRIIEGAGAIATSYAGIDFTELIQEVNEIGSELNITDQEALGLTNSLLKIGFPTEQLDIIAEYGKQLTDAGYSAEEVQAIMAAGVETGTWNIDNLLDGLKEGRILLAEFGQGVDESTAELLEGTGISTQQLQEWGQAVAQGGDAGKQAMQEVAQALNNVDDETTKNALGVKFFGTMYEDQGQNIIDTLLNAESATVDLKEGQDAVNESVRQLDQTPAVQMKQAMSDLVTASAPVLTTIANIIGQVSSWISANPQLAATLVIIGSVIGIVSGAIMALTPIVTTVIGVVRNFGMVFSFLTGPVGIAIAVITAIIGIVILLWQNWDTVSQWLVTAWNWLWGMAVTIFTAIGQFFANIWNSIKITATMVWNGITNFFGTIWNGIRNIAVTVFNAVVSFFSAVWQTISNVATTVWNAITGFLSGIWNGIRNTVTTVFSAIRNFITTIWNTIRNVSSTVWNVIVSVVTGIINRFRSVISNVFSTIRNVISTVWNAIKSVSTSIWNGIRNTIGNIINGIRSTISRVFNGIRNTITNVWNRIKSTTSSIWDGITGAIRGAVNGVIRIINGMINAINRVQITLPSIPDWVPGIGGMGGQTIGFNIPNIPSLATGGVIYEPTLALVGDAGYGNPEIVAPQDLLSSIIANELRKFFESLKFESNDTSDGKPIEIIVPVIIDGREVARVTAPHMDRELGKKRIGKSRAEGEGDYL